MSERGKQVCFCFETRLTVSSAFKADISIDKFPDHGQLDLQDFSTQIAWWSSYRQECKTHGVTVGANRYVPPCLAEHIAGKMLVLIFLTVKVHFFFVCAGLPKGWTVPRVGSVDRGHFNSLFPTLTKAELFRFFLLWLRGMQPEQFYHCNIILAAGAVSHGHIPV